MEDRMYIISLYDLYKELFTLKQQVCFERYYFDDLTLSEISEELNISRSFIQKNIKNIKEKLCYYEKILKKKALSDYINSLEDKKLKEELGVYL